MCSYDGRKDDLSGVVVGKSNFHRVAVVMHRSARLTWVRTVLNNLYFQVIFHIGKTHYRKYAHFNWEVENIRKKIMESINHFPFFYVKLIFKQYVFSFFWLAPFLTHRNRMKITLPYYHTTQIVFSTIIRAHQAWLRQDWWSSTVRTVEMISFSAAKLFCAFSSPIWKIYINLLFLFSSSSSFKF